MHSAALTVNMTSAHSMNDLNLTSHDLIMSAVGVPVTAQAGPVVPQGVLHTENATSGVVTNAVSVGSLNLQAVQQVPQQNPNATPNNQKNSSNQKGQNSAKVNNRESSATATAGGMCDEKTVEYLRDLIEEKKTIENNNNGGKNHEDIHEIVGGSSTNASAILGPKSIVLRLLDQEIARIQSGGKPPGRDSKFVDIYHEKPIRLTVRALVPVKEHPKFNFVGKLLGPKGNSMKRLQEDTMTKMAVLGRGSMRNKQQEEELRKSSDPKYQHLNDDLHVEITAFAPPSEAHARIAYALTEVRKYLIPDSNDEIRQEQMREMELLNTSTTTSTSPNSSILKNLPLSNSDGQDDVASDETGSNSSAQGSTSSPSPPSSTLIAMRGMMGSATSNGGPQSQTQRIGNGRRLHHTINSQSQGNVPPRSGGSSKYLRGHLFAAASTVSAAAAGGSAVSGSSTASAASVGAVPTTSQRPNTSKVRVLSILDKIRSSTHENYPNSRPSSMTTSAQTIQTNNEALIDAISLVEDNGFTFEEYEGNTTTAHTMGLKGVKTSALERGRYRMHIAPYVRPK